MKVLIVLEVNGPTNNSIPNCLCVHEQTEIQCVISYIRMGYDFGMDDEQRIDLYYFENVSLFVNGIEM